jgi:hypothetical protein
MKIYSDESGNGFALRMLGQNGLTFSDLAKVVASIGHRYVPATAASQVAYLFGESASSLHRAIPYTYKSNGRLVARFMDQCISRPYHLRHTRPQVCTQCLSELGRALAVWEISLVTACHTHGFELIDACPQCNRSISWRRPSLRICVCGFDFASHQPELAKTEHIWISRCIEKGLLGGSASHNIINELHYLSNLSLDSILRLLRSVGISEHDDGRDLLPGKLTRVLRTNEAQKVLNRAITRLRQISSNKDSKNTGNQPQAWGVTEVLEDTGIIDYLLVAQVLESVSSNALDQITRRSGIQQLALNFGVDRG